MIRINLLKPLQAQSPLHSLDGLSSEPSRKGLWIGVAAVAVVLGGGFLLLNPDFLGGKSGKVLEEAPTVKAEAPAKPTPPPPKPKPTTAYAVEEIVRDVQSEQAKETAPPAYSALVPSQKIEFQQRMGVRILQDVKAATPPEIGFARFIFTPPGEYYVHGLAASEADLRRFKQGLQTLPGAEIRDGMLNPVPQGSGKEFSLFGKVRYPMTGARPLGNKVVSEADLAQALRQWSAEAKQAGLRMGSVKQVSSVPLGSGARRVYEASGSGSYRAVQNFLARIHESESPIGLIRLTLQADRNGDMRAQFDLLAYLN